MTRGEIELRASLRHCTLTCVGLLSLALTSCMPDMSCGELYTRLDQLLPIADQDCGHVDGNDYCAAINEALDLIIATINDQCGG